ncbi:MAG: hypothetical protein M3494_07040 [Actinomycetota bacterium]|nr:hypothetical protein [Rubrobacter sp.]MDQ3507754.1 hypothetical protein [Actinomycetota bacterium]
MTPHEGMDSELMKVALRISDDPESARKYMKPIRSSKALAPGVYYNAGTRMVERLHSSQRPPLGNRIFRISKNPAESVESIERKITGGG